MGRDRILIVEDEPNIVESLRFILERAQFDVEVSSSGSDGLDRLRRQSFAAVILDIMLPGINGLEVLKHIRDDHKIGSMPVLVLTAKGQARDREAAEGLGADAFVTKPFSNAELVERVREIAGR